MKCVPASVCIASEIVRCLQFSSVSVIPFLLSKKNHLIAYSNIHTDTYMNTSIMRLLTVNFQSVNFVVMFCCFCKTRNYMGCSFGNVWMYARKLSTFWILKDCLIMPKTYVRTEHFTLPMFYFSPNWLTNKQFDHFFLLFLLGSELLLRNRNLYSSITTAFHRFSTFVFECHLHLCTNTTFVCYGTSSWSTQ